MRYLVTPTFSEKVTRSDQRVLAEVAAMLKRIEATSREELVTSAETLFEGNGGVYALRGSEFRVLLSFGEDRDGDYALLVDLIVHGGATMRPLPSRDPRRNMTIDPNRNMMIDPRRNMMIDPRRNMTIDPNRNMMIDPRRNMMIDPNRNMMIDPRRNMMIDPRRNMTIDPDRNWLLDPRRNSVWDGPYCFDTNGRIVGFIVRASEKVALLFDQDAKFIGPVVPAGTNYNLFSTDGRWIGYLVPNSADGFNRFDVSGDWVGYIVGKVLAESAGG